MPALQQFLGGLACLLLSSLTVSHRPTVVKLDVPLARQPYNLCLPASVSMVMAFWGVTASPAAIADHVELYKGGTTGKDLLGFVERVGMRGFLLQPEFPDLLVHLERGRPVIVEVPGSAGGRHAMVLVGFDGDSSIVWLNDPASGRTISMGWNEFRKGWAEAGRWTFLVVPR